MRQSKEWNGQEAAFRFVMTILGVTVLVAQRDDAPEAPGATRPQRRARLPQPPERAQYPATASAFAGSIRPS